MQNMALGNLSFITGPGATTGFGVTLDPNIQGLDSAAYRIVNYPVPGQDGGRVSQAWYDSRTITLQGIISGATPTEYMQNRYVFSQACQINRDSYGFPTLTELAFTTMDGASYFVMVQVQQPVFAMAQPTWCKYQVSLLAPNPFIYGQEQLTSGQITRQVSGGIIVPTIVPVPGGGVSGGSGYVTNAGTTDTYPTLTFNGPLTNPYVTNQTTGQAFQLDLTIPGGISVVVDMYEKSVVYGGSSNYIGYMDDISEWWTLAPGYNNILLGTSSSADTGNVVVTAYSAYLGV